MVRMTRSLFVFDIKRHLKIHQIEICLDSNNKNEKCETLVLYSYFDQLKKKINDHAICKFTPCFIAVRMCPSKSLKYFKTIFVS